MKAEILTCVAPVSFRLTGKQMKAIVDSWCERWGRTPEQAEKGDMTEEDALIEAESLGFIELPEGWECK